jgi:hypothetical protein
MDREDKYKQQQKHQHKKDKDRQSKSDDKYGIPPGDTSFVQTKQQKKDRQANMLCQVCGGHGHHALVCPTNSDTEPVLDDDRATMGGQLFSYGTQLYTSGKPDTTLYCNFD